MKCKITLKQFLKRILIKLRLTVFVIGLAFTSQAWSAISVDLSRLIAYVTPRLASQNGDEIDFMTSRLDNARKRFLVNSNTSLEERTALFNLFRLAILNAATSSEIQALSREAISGVISDRRVGEDEVRNFLLGSIEFFKQIQSENKAISPYHAMQVLGNMGFAGVNEHLRIQALENVPTQANNISRLIADRILAQYPYSKRLDESGQISLIHALTSFLRNQDRVDNSWERESLAQNAIELLTGISPINRSVGALQASALHEVRTSRSCESAFKL